MIQIAQSSPSAGLKLPTSDLGKQVLSEERRQEIVQTAMAFPMEKILRRYAKDENLPWEEAVEHEREIKRFLTVCALNPGKTIGMAGKIDELWHTFIMFTREYHHFCMLAAGRYLHHAPVTDEDRKAPKSGPAPYVVFWKEYSKIFGEEPPAHLWPHPKKEAGPKPCFSCGADCDDRCTVGICACTYLCGYRCDGECGNCP